jgi:lysozyme
MNTDHRSYIAILVLSAAGFVGLAVDEGYTSKAVPDPVKGTAVPTLGFGTTGGVKMGDTTTPPKAMQRTLTDVQAFEGALKRCVRVPLFQHEYDAYVNLAYNIGAGKSGVTDGFCEARRGGSSTLVKRLNALDYKGACDAILDWRFVGDVDCAAPGNKSCPGLWARRLKTHAQCLGPAAAGAAP